MIQAYLADNTDFTKNGDMVLMPSKCILQTVLNGNWVLELEHPLDPEGRWKYIENEGVISAPTFLGEQLFRIKAVTKTDTGITAEAYPIFFDSADDVFIKDTRPENKNGQDALDLLCAGTKYKGRSDIATKATAYFERRNLLNALQGGEDPTFLSRWGGEILFDNYEVIINKSAGLDRGVQILYGRNMTGVSSDEDMSEVVTSIVPVAYNGRSIGDNFTAVDSPLVNTYTKKYIKEIKFEDIYLAADKEGEEEGGTKCADQAALDAALRKACQEQFDAGIDKPKVTVEVTMADLSRTNEYKEFSDLEEVHLGDIVTCRNSRLGIDVKAKVTELEWDCIQNRSETIKLGNYEKVLDTLKNSLVGDKLSALDNVLTDDGDIVAGRIKGVINAMKAQFAAQKNVAQKSDVRAILFEDLDPASPNFGALSIGTQGVQISRQRTADGRDWEWTTALTFQGLIADVIIAGIISDKTGKSYWNLDTGEFVLENGTIKAGKISGSTISGTTVTGGTISGTTVTGSTISGNEITGGTITGTSINNGNGTFSVDANGNLKASKANITGAVNATSGTFNGKITADSGTIGGWTIGNNISGGDTTTGRAIMQAPSADTTNVFVAGTHQTGDVSDAPFRVTKDGKLYATDADIKGKVTATSGSFTGAVNASSGTFKGTVDASKITADNGTIGGWELTSASIRGGNSSTGTAIMHVPSADANSVTVFAAGGKSHESYGDAPFRVTKDGTLYATKANIEGKVTASSGSFTGAVNATSGTFNGKVTADSGTIGGWTITDTKMYGGSSANGYSIMRAPNNNSTYVFSAGGTSADSSAGAPFRVTKDGHLYATDATVSGTVTANKLVSATGTVNGVTGTYKGSIASGGTFTGTANSATLKTCSTGGTSLTVTKGNISSANGYMVIYPDSWLGINAGSYLYTFRNTGTCNINDIEGHNLTCSGKKNRVVPTDHFGRRLLDAYETPFATFSDYGEGRTDETGTAYIPIDPVFAETVDMRYKPAVFLTPYGAGDIWYSADESMQDMAVIRGTPDLRFSWEVRYHQTNSYSERIPQQDVPDDAGGTDFVQQVIMDMEKETDYADAGAEYFENFEEGLTL